MTWIPSFIIKECLDVLLTPIFVAMKNQDYTALLLIDLLAAFDTINHQILLDRLKEWFGLGKDGNAIFSKSERFLTAFALPA